MDNSLTGSDLRLQIYHPRFRLPRCGLRHQSFLNLSSETDDSVQINLPRRQLINSGARLGKCAARQFVPEAGRFPGAR